MIMNRDIVVFLLLFCLAAASPAASQNMPENREPEIGGWLSSGDTFTVYPRPLRGDPAGGRFVPISSAREVRALYASDDTLWIGTEGGLFAWDIMADSIFAVRDFPLRSVRTITMDDYYRLWVGCDLGICLRDSTWRVYTRNQNRFFSRVRDLTVGSARMWVGTWGRGCGFLTEDSLIVYTMEDSLLDDRVLSIAEETASDIWFGTASGVCRADSFRWESMRYGRKIPIGAVNDLIFDENRNLFAAIRRNGVARLKFGKTVSYGAADGLPGWNISEFSLAPDGRVFAAGERGVSYYDGSGWTPLITEGISLGGYRFLSIFQDFAGNSYLGTDEGSVIVLERNGWSRLNLPGRFPLSTISKLYRAGPELYIISAGSLYRHADTVERIPLPAPWFDGAVTGVVNAGDGGLWLSTRFGALNFSDRRWKVFDRRIGLPTEYLTCVERGPDGGIWFGTFDRGVLCLKDDRFLYYAKESGLSDPRIADIKSGREKNLYALTLSGRLFAFNGSSWYENTPAGAYIPGDAAAEEEAGLTFRDDPAVKILPDRDNETGTVRSDICIGRSGDSGILYVGPEAVYSNASGEWMRMDLPDIGNGITPSAVIESSGKELWIGTASSGILVYRDKGWLNYGLESGFRAESVTSLAESAEGTIWIGTGFMGLYMYHHRPGAESPPVE
jgi:ligand-binding sensor domain-containing protein